MTITEFLEARIAEDEQLARQEDADYADTTLLPTYDSDHQANWNTNRVLAECAAKRAIIRRHATITVWPDGTGGANYYYGSKQVCASCDERTQTPCPTIGLLAAVYKDHPDYQQEWAE